MPCNTHPLPLLAILVAVSACKKEEGNTPPEPPAPLSVSSFSVLVPGNYWVYEVHRVDSTDADIAPMNVDSFFVEGDTVLLGETFSIIRKAHDGLVTAYREYWRDSADCIVDHMDLVRFKTASMGQVFESDLQGVQSYGVIIDYSINPAQMPLTLPAGNFDTYEVYGQVTSLGGMPDLPAWKSPRRYWAQGIGRVRWYDFFSLGTEGFRNDLLRYHVQ